MTDDWKWVLRASVSTRPALCASSARSGAGARGVLRKVSGTFSDTRGFAQVSAGPGARPSGPGATNPTSARRSRSPPRCLATTTWWSAATWAMAVRCRTPATAFRTTYSRDVALIGAPEVSVTVRQLQVPSSPRSVADPGHPGRGAGAADADVRVWRQGRAGRSGQLRIRLPLRIGELCEPAEFRQPLRPAHLPPGQGPRVASALRLGCAAAR